MVVPAFHWNRTNHGGRDGLCTGGRVPGKDQDIIQPHNSTKPVQSILAGSAIRFAAERNPICSKSASVALQSMFYPLLAVFNVWLLLPTVLAQNPLQVCHHFGLNILRRADGFLAVYRCGTLNAVPAQLACAVFSGGARTSQVFGIAFLNIFFAFIAVVALRNQALADIGINRKVYNRIWRRRPSFLYSNSNSHSRKPSQCIGGSLEHW